MILSLKKRTQLTWAVTIVAILLIIIVSLVSYYLNVFAAIPRELDPHPLTKQVQTTESSSKPDIAYVSMELDTGGGPGYQGIQTGLRLLVRHQDKLYYQLFASCNDAGFGGSLEFPMEAICDDRSFLVDAVDNMVIVQEKGKGIITRIQLPDAVQYVLPRY